MNRRQLALVFGVVFAALAAIVALLATGGTEPGTTPAQPEGAGDVELGDGPDPPAQPERADILAADVRTERGGIVFEVQLGAPLPTRTRGESLDVRWQVYENGVPTWGVSANFDVAPTASLISQDATFGVSTFDDTLPGTIEVDGDVIRVRLRGEEVEGFPPGGFTWETSTILDGAPGDPASALARDRHPDTGVREFVPGN